MGRGFNAFIGGAIGGARRAGAAYGNAYKGMLSAQAEAEKRRREEERLQMERERLGLARNADARAATEAAEPDIIRGPNGEPMVLEGGKLRVLPGAPEKAPEDPNVAAKREADTYYARTGERIAGKPGAGGPRRTPTQQAADEALQKTREAAVGQIPMQQRQAAQRELEDVKDEARARLGKGEFATDAEVMAVIKGDPLLQQLYDQAIADVQSALGGGTTSSTGKKTDANIIDAMEAIR